jgi:alkylation response protein AidB-like acyl-CoA dehydrogenase
VSIFALSPEEAQLASAVRVWLAGFADNSYLNEQEGSELGYEPARWQQLCELGWTSVHVPASAGGADGTLTHAALIARECGRAAYASPLLQTLRAATVLTTLAARPGAGDPVAGTVLAGDVLAGDVLASIAAGQPAVLVAPPDRTVRAERAGRGYRLTGAPATVEWLNQSETAVLLLPVANGERWLCAAVRRDDLAGRAEDVPSTDNERAARLDLDGMVLDGETIRAEDVPAPDAACALARAGLLRASLMVGGCQDVLERTARYARGRYQFGQPIGGFQAVRHHLARMVIATDGARLLCDDALTRAEPGIAAAALFAAGRSYVEVVLTGAQVHGGVGTTVEHILHHHFRRAKAMQLRSGKRANRLRELHEALVAWPEGSLW